MPLSFWFFLGVCVISFVPVVKDHGDTWREVLSSTGKARQNFKIQLFALWAIPIFTAIATIVTGVEAVTSGRENAKLIKQAGDANKLAAESNERSLQLELQIKNLNPTNQPIFSASASASILVEGTNRNPRSIVAGGVSTKARLLTCETEVQARFGAGTFAFKSDKYFEAIQVLPAVDARVYDMQFDLDVAWAVAGTNIGSASRIEQINFATIWLEHLPLDAEIVGGSVQLVINSNLRREFTILPQTAFEPLTMTNTPEYIDHFRIIATFGTNKPPHNRGPRRE